MKPILIPFCVFVLFALLLLTKGTTETKLNSLIKKSPELYARKAQFHAKSLKRFSLGFDYLIADLLWIRLLQKTRDEKVESGKVSWEFMQLDAITALDPKFRRAYWFGAGFLSVLLQDKLGAKLILEKWANRSPRYWRPHYLLGYHLFYEMNQYTAAARHILKASKMAGAPFWLSSLGIRLLSETGSLTQALKIALSLYPSLRTEIGQERLKMRIRSLRYSLQKASWEDALTAYRKEHKQEPSTLSDLAPLRQSRLRALASVLQDAHIPNELQPLLREAFTFYYDPKTKKIESTNKNIDIETHGIHRRKVKS